MSLSRLRRLGLVALTAGPLAILPAAVPATAAPAAPPPPPPPPANGPASTVTLITGDRVTTAADGGVQVRDPQGRLTGFLSGRKGGDTYVYPHDALPYLASGLLDDHLFNVTELVADGYDDAHSDRLPLIVTYHGGTAARSRAALTGATGVRPLASIGGAALTTDRSGTFLSSITGGAGSARAQAKAGPISGTVKKIWLDGKAKAALAESTAQIGAPEVWRTGDIGTGVDVAVLDTGIDTGHPDLAGQVAAGRSFVPDESIEDGKGHGTHVASTIAGTGAASGGKEQGVAPGARLHIGKVLADDGYGQDSWIISGMEWAVRDQHARVVNMSLGADPTDGTDPMSQAVNELSAETGALFVISAGNAGPGAYSVGTPGAADAALTVGAVDNKDLLTFFSSQGPRLGDRALKPDLTAPGADILAARSQHIDEGEGPYLTMSGTSMAAPHVTGAAALLLAEHPGLTGQQLKDALVSTTKATPDVTAYQGGTGRLDVAAAAKATVFATGSVTFGYPDYPTAPTGPVNRTITYTNTGASPVTLTLSTSLDLITLSGREVTVPAHGTATVTATTSFDTVPGDRTFSGFVTATGGPAGLRTSVAVGQEGVRHHLTLKALDRSGRATGGQLVLLGKETTITQQIDGSGTLDLRLPEDTYTAWLTTDVEGTHGPSSKGLAVLPVAGITLDQDRTVVFDAAEARRSTATTPRPATVTSARYELIRDVAGSPWLDGWYPGPEYDSVWVLPTTRVTDGRFVLAARWHLTQPVLTVAGYDDLRVQRGATPLPDTLHHVDVVTGGDARGKALLVRTSDTVTIEEQAAAAAKAGAQLLLVVNDGPGRLTPWPGSVWSPADPPPVTVATLTADEGEQLITRVAQEGRVRLRATSDPVTAYAYDLVTDYTGAIPADLTYRATAGNLARADVSMRNWRPGQALELRSDTDPLGSAASLDYAETPARGDRTDWITAGETWVAEAVLPGEQSQHSAPTAYQAGSKHPEHWFGPVQRPRLVDEPDGLLVFRQEGGWLFANIPGWGDSGTAHAGRTTDNPDVDNRMALYQGDKLVSSADRYTPLLVAGPLAAGRLPYRLVSENTRGAWAGPYSTSTRTEWTFDSGDVAPGTVVSPPLIQLDYAVDTDPDGKAKRTSDLTIGTSVLRSATGAGTVRTVTLDVSYDEGVTWHPASLKARSGGWETRMDAPATAQFVTLRTTASDTVGNTVSQQITRAFGLR
ncbi:S8 family serine peptidase [Actinoplanes sp. N902-109]|uniref:S8 family serine peptidase n=1 Tax=Actinoplanes sp. (strain N902-109) TaxID=649831 RepID=UPI0003293E9D|nr:S8 family serine peptidase [Actinoplanes sp. N902-109]AGL16782.1 subtilisin-like secreted protease [Actinoplanes sp. N902-109]